MGCTHSSDGSRHRGGRAKGGGGSGGDTPAAKDQASARLRYRKLLAAADMTSDCDQLYDELDMRTVSHAVAASEPGDSQHEKLCEGLVRRGARFGINADPHQFPITVLDFPEFRRRDRRRVEEWDRDCVHAYRRGAFAPLPADGIAFSDAECERYGFAAQLLSEPQHVHHHDSDQRQPSPYDESSQSSHYVAKGTTTNTNTTNTADSASAGRNKLTVERPVHETPPLGAAKSPLHPQGTKSPLRLRGDSSFLSCTGSAPVHPVFFVGGESVRSDGSVWLQGFTDAGSEFDSSARSNNTPGLGHGGGARAAGGGGEGDDSSPRSAKDSNAATFGRSDLLTGAA